MHEHSCNIAYQTHNHHHCIDDAVAAARAVCNRNNVKLTPLREDVLVLVWQSHRALGAYDILAALSQKAGRHTAPPTVYRALDFLQEQGLVHRLATLNAYIGCCHPEKPHTSEFLICAQCGVVVETHAHQTMLSNTQGFSVQSVCVEALGICPACQHKAAL